MGFSCRIRSDDALILEEGDELLHVGTQAVHLGLPIAIVVEWVVEVVQNEKVRSVVALRAQWHGSLQFDWHGLHGGVNEGVPLYRSVRAPMIPERYS